MSKDSAGTGVDAVLGFRWVRFSVIKILVLLAATQTHGSPSKCISDPSFGKGGTVKTKTRRLLPHLKITRTASETSERLESAGATPEGEDKESRLSFML